MRRSKKPHFAFQTFTETQPLPHQHWGLELRTSLTGAGMARNVLRNSEATRWVIGN